MSTEQAVYAPTEELIDDIYRQKVLQARRMRPEDKLLAGPRIFTGVCKRMAAGLRNENPGADECRIQELLRARLALLRRLSEPQGRWTETKQP